MKLTVKTLIITTLCAAFTACGSVPKIPDDATSTQLIQMGQDAMEIPNYNAAETYYTAVIQRYGMDTNTYIEANYELGHMYLKKKDYQKAYAKFNEILGIYEYAEAGALPGSYKKLAQMGMDKIPSKYKNN